MVIEMLVTHLVTHGLKVRGLFRVSCNAERAREVKAKLDRRTQYLCLVVMKRFNGTFITGETVVFEEGEDDCHVAGSLLKSLLRELPEPLFTFDLYAKVLAAPGTALEHLYLGGVL